VASKAKLGGSYSIMQNTNQTRGEAKMPDQESNMALVGSLR
jgi:hypothetical protein